MKATILVLMLLLSPPEKWRAAKGFEETESVRLARYESIASDVASVADGSITGSVRGDVAILVAVTFLESAWFLDVDRGPCRPGYCDRGKSACIAQIRLGAGKTREQTHGIAGLTQADLFRDRKLCLRVASFMLRKSFRGCAREGPDARMDLYASGKCGHGRTEGVKRLRLMDRLLGRIPK